MDEVRGSIPLGSTPEKGRMTDPPAERAFRWYDPRSARGRLVLAIAFGVGAMLAMPVELSWAGRFVGGWDIGALVLLSLSWTIIARADPKETRHRAGSEDPGRTMVMAIVVVTAMVSLFAATIAMRHAKTLNSGMAGLLVAMCFAAVASSWAVTHTSYTFRYAHLYYRDDGAGEGGLQFPGEEQPCDSDFAYFAFVIGMCFQTSDVTVTSRLVRRDVLVHSILSFLYNTAIVALTLNLVFGFLG
jgi:uncharacterized membrane protein